MLLTMLHHSHGANPDDTVMPALSILHCKSCNIMDKHNNRWRSHLSSHRRLRIRNSLGVPVRISLKPSATAAAATASAAAATATADSTATNTGSTVAAVSALNAANSNSDVVSDVAPRGDVSVWIAGGSAVHLLLYTKKTRGSAANQQLLIAAITTTLVTLFTIMHCVYHTATGIEDGVLEIPTLDALEGAIVEVYIEGWKPVRGVKPDLLSGEKQLLRLERPRQPKAMKSSSKHNSKKHSKGDSSSTSTTTSGALAACVPCLAAQDSPHASEGQFSAEQATPTTRGSASPATSDTEHGASSDSDSDDSDDADVAQVQQLEVAPSSAVPVKSDKSAAAGDDCDKSGSGSGGSGGSRGKLFGVRSGGRVGLAISYTPSPTCDPHELDMVMQLSRCYVAGYQCIMLAFTQCAFHATMIARVALAVITHS
eukprot:5767-Heterococcus_DN1.PRE.1